jgi:hypothetical protein
MATVGTPLPQDHIKALDSLRSRLSQLSTSITLLKQQLEFADTIPPWYRSHVDDRSLDLFH